jgi:hypothetical protein
MLPSNEPGSPLAQTWAPVLAWIVLRRFPVQSMSVSLFDKLQLRSALAETFSSLGMEGEQTWQMAARVRALLAHADAPLPFAMQSESFWADSDIRWLTGVNESGGKTYVNKEQFEEMLSWMQLPALLEAAQQTSNRLQSLKEIEAVVTAACQAMTEAGYDLNKLLQNAISTDGEKIDVLESEVPDKAPNK